MGYAPDLKTLALAHAFDTKFSMQFFFPQPCKDDVVSHAGMAYKSSRGADRLGPI